MAGEQQGKRPTASDVRVEGSSGSGTGSSRTTTGKTRKFSRSRGSVCNLCKGTGEFDLSRMGHPGVVEDCAGCGGTGRTPPRHRAWVFKGWSIPATRLTVVHRGDARYAPLDVLRRRTYMRVYRLPFRRLLIVSWLDL